MTATPRRHRKTTSLDSHEECESREKRDNCTVKTSSRGEETPEVYTTLDKVIHPYTDDPKHKPLLSHEDAMYARRGPSADKRQVDSQIHDSQIHAPVR